MKILNYIYFNIYSWYHIDGKKPKYKNEQTASEIAAIVMAGGVAFWYMLIDEIISYTTKHQRNLFISKIGLIIFGGIMYVIFRIIFVKNENYKIVYDTYKHYDIENKILGRVISIGMFVALPVIIFLLLAFILP
jgi:hypothetical protein